MRSSVSLMMSCCRLSILFMLFALLATCGHCFLPPSAQQYAHDVVVSSRLSSSSSPPPRLGLAAAAAKKSPKSLAVTEEDPIQVAAVLVEVVEEEQKEDSLTITSTTVKDSFLSDKNRILLLLWSIACLSALDRVAMSVAMVPLTALDPTVWTDGVKGSISSLFSVGYGLGIVPAGLVVVTQSPRTVMAVGICVWSLATLATPAGIGWMSTSTTTMLPLLGLRAAVGLGESILIPSVQRTLAVWTSETEKSRALAWIFSGFAAGTVLAYLLSPVILEWGSWSSLFYVYGCMGLTIIVPWLVLAKDAPTAVEEKDAELTLAMSEPNQSNVLESFQDAPWMDFARSPGVWGMLLAHSAKNWGLYNSLAWTPTFYAEQYGLSVADSALLSVVPSIAGAACGFVAGWSADALLQRAQLDDPTPVRKLFQGIGLLGPALALGGLAWHIPASATTAQWFLMVSVGLQSFNSAGFEAGNQEKAGPKWTGLLYSVTSLPAVWFGTLGVWVTGQVLDASGQDWSVVFSINAAINVLGAVAFITLFDSRREFE